ncbi:hypothetical protein ACRQ1B_28500 [Rhizobium panacihumi]|uniref:hypothetical protein n=1 Tax=Rhizobium panacihumi TaxID=2008450 RepID=UPI003D7BD442
MSLGVWEYSVLGLIAWGGLLGKQIVQGRTTQPILAVTISALCAGVITVAIALLDYTAHHALGMMGVR